MQCVMCPEVGNGFTGAGVGVGEVEVYCLWLCDRQLQTPLVPPFPVPYIESLSSAFICSGES